MGNINLLGLLKESEDDTIPFLQGREPTGEGQSNLQIIRTLKEIIRAVEKIEDKLGFDSGISDARQTLEGYHNAGLNSGE